MRCAVITGDLISSTTSTEEVVTDTMNLIHTIADEVGPDTRFTRHRGDGWQIILTQPGLALRAMCCIAARLASAGRLQSRMVIGLGTAGGLSGSSLAAASGTAFTASGRTLDHMPKGRMLDVAGDGVDALHSNLIAYIDRQIQGWSAGQSEAAAHVLTMALPPPQVVTAAKLGISRQAFAARLSTSGYEMIDAATAAFFTVFNEVAEND